MCWSCTVADQIGEVSFKFSCSSYMSDLLGSFRLFQSVGVASFVLEQIDEACFYV